MNWFTSLFKNNQTQGITPHTLDTHYDFDHLDIRSLININVDCETELAKYRELSYTPLPQRVYSIGIAHIEQIGYLRRYYLNDGDTWLQCTYLEETAATPIEIILFYWVEYRAIESLQQAKEPLYCQQWLHNDELFPRVWLTAGQGYQPQLFSEQINNSQESYQMHYEAMLFGKVINEQNSRRQYWLYALEKDSQNNWQQAIAQGFSITPAELCK